MESCFGWTLPAGRAGAGLGDRAVVAALVDGRGCLHDASYWCCFRVEGALDAVRAVLGTVVGPAEREKVVAWAGGLAADSRGRETSVELRGLVASESISGARQCIGPAHVTLLPTQSPAQNLLALVWVHAAAARDAASALQTACRDALHASLALADLRRVELRGRHSEGALERALGVRCEDVPAEGVAIVSIRDPRFRDYSALSHLGARETGSSNPEPSSAAALLSHPRAASETEASQKNAQARDRALGIAAETDQSRLDLDACASRCSLLCIRRETWDAGALSGWSICLPAGWVSPFWSALVAAGMTVAGQQEWRWMHTARGVPFFPADFAGTSACQRHRDVAGSLDRSANLLRPPLKRRTLGQSLDWGAGGGSRVRRAMARPLKGGRPAELALLLVPQPFGPMQRGGETPLPCRPRRLRASDAKALAIKLADSPAPLVLGSEVELVGDDAADAPLRLRVAGQITSPAPRPCSAAVACVDGAVVGAGDCSALCWNPGSAVLLPVRLAMI
ncbi:hypothetical protein H632_c1018p1 [Helicosporidium sp. ATCC 50920]|nr:hypothetical protein H632_c1018p1 [Helicosporidium sp. ATCC 50920]|eukprot:KDD74874.1 hypothetical protein H632_c1018p1 [Helicosporidium sp. ATCC 50920]